MLVPAPSVSVASAMSSASQRASRPTYFQVTASPLTSILPSAHHTSHGRGAQVGYGNRVSPASSKSAYALAVAASVAAGVLVAGQSRVNGELGVAMGDGALAALISFSSGLLILSLAMAVSAKARAGFATIVAELRAGALPWWGVLGGLGGAFLVLTQGLTAGILGVALFSVAVVAGQTLGAMWIDHRGLLGVLRVRLSPPRVVGALLVVVGVVVSVEVWAGSASALGWAFILPLVSGAGTGVQQALNGRLRNRASSALAATFINFTVGTSALIVVWLVLLPVTGGPDALPTQWWLYAGGLLGTLFIPIQTITVHRIGVLGLGVSLVTGQILGSLGLDYFLPVGDFRLGLWTVVGALLTIVGSALVTVARKPA